MNIELLSFEAIVILGMAAGVVSLTLTRSHAFEWLRNLLVNLACFIGQGFAHQIDKLVHCHYCTGHWTSFLFVILAIKLDGPLYFVVTWFSVTAIAVLFSSLVEFLMMKAE